MSSSGSTARFCYLIDSVTDVGYGVKQVGNKPVVLANLSDADGVALSAWVNTAQLRTTLFASGGSEFKQDTSTGAFAQVTYEHNEIHSGSHFNYCDYDVSGLGVGDTIKFVLTTPDTTTWAHFSFAIFSSTGATVELYEGTSGVSGGATITPRNNNRNSGTASVVGIVKDPASITSDGTRAAGYLAGANREAGFVVRENENVLKQNETYLLRITSLASSNNVSWCAEWYEHADR